MWNQGIHSRSGVACADCHMPYQRVGALKVSDHHVQSPLLNVNRACQTCHVAGRAGARRQIRIQLCPHATQRRRRGRSVDTTSAPRPPCDATRLEPALKFQRRRWRLDFIAAENSMGFHAPQEAGRILGEAIDYARQGQLSARALLPAGEVVPSRTRSTTTGNPAPH
jgi:nitrite reductase (cytochrome c-552)